MKKWITALLSLSLLAGAFFAPVAQGLDTKTATAKEELHAVWISTVFRADFPSNQQDMNAQKAEYTTKLDQAKELGMNAAVVQIRPKADAFYPSNINPWSQILTGTQGKNPGYDPLAFMIQETHNRGMEFHAWMNPYRITTKGTDLSALAENHPARLHPDWVITYNDALYYNPALPAVRQHIADSVAEIVRNYNVDAIHFDDYFYPSNYPLTDGQGREGAQANQRREYVNQMVSLVHQTIESIKPNVAFGISPAGIWKNNTSDPTGSATKGFEGYYSVYGDVRYWIQNNLVDYIVPQIYWETTTAAAPYETVLKWWVNEVKGTDVALYIGQGIYQDGVAAQIGQQLTLNDTYGTSGSFYFSLRDLLSNRGGCAPQIKAHIAAHNTVTPTPVPTPVPEPTPEPTPVPTPTPAPTDGLLPAISGTASITVDGKPVSIDAYNIKDNNYVKLRDVAMALNGTQKQFDTLWDETQRSINLAANTPYQPTGDELTGGKGTDNVAQLSTAGLLLNGKPISLTAYNIDGLNYFKLRDLGNALNFGIFWSEENKVVIIESSMAYTQE